MPGKSFKVAVCGATGAVGREMLAVLEEREFPISELVLLASERSAGTKLEFRDEEITVRKLTKESFAGCQIGLFSPGAAVSREFAPFAAAAGCVVVDNSSAFRMDPDVPLVVPEVNPGAIAGHRKKGIIANPNCSTIQMVVALKPLHDAAGLARVVVSTYQSVSGAGQKGIAELEEQTIALLNHKDFTPHKFPHRIAFNVLPGGWPPQPNGYNEEEMKMINETRKIMGLPSLAITATCVRVPVFVAHSESVNITTDRKLGAAEARELLRKAPGIKVVDAPEDHVWPMPMLAVGDDAVLVGRIREDLSQPNGLELFVVADNLRKGAATNAVQIAELLAKEHLG
jgi:aspartate-semialdehyde dehydrogenase